MSSEFTLRFLTPLALGAVALAFIGLGLYGLLKQRPFIIHARWMLVLVLLPMLPLIIDGLTLSFEAGRHPRNGLGLLSVLNPLMMVILVFVLERQMRGYMVFATTQESFRAALLSALSSQNLAFEETMSSIRLPSVPAEIHVSAQPWTGMGLLRLRTGGRPGLLPDIARSMNEYFDNAQVTTNMTILVLYLILGVLMGVMDLALASAA